jgi:uncharacterized protein
MKRPLWPLPVWLRRAAIGLAALLVFGWSSASAYLYLQQRNIIYLPTREWVKTPQDFGVNFEPFQLEVKRADGLRESISAWWLPAPEPNGHTVLFLHGNARNMGAAGNAEKVAGLAKAGFNVLTIDYRGFGKSDGEEPYEAALYEDAAVALAELQRRAPQPARRILHGHSLGGAVAIDLAARHPGEFGVAFLEATFTSMFEMSTLNRLYRLLPVNTLLTERFDSRAKLPSLKLPVLFIHGTADNRIPHRMSRELFAGAGEPKAFIQVEGGGHNNLHTHAQYGGAYRLLLEMARK